MGDDGQNEGKDYGNFKDRNVQCENDNEMIRLLNKSIAMYVSPSSLKIGFLSLIKPHCFLRTQKDYM